MGSYERKLPCGSWSQEPQGRLNQPMAFGPPSLVGGGLGSVSAVRKADAILAGQLPWYSHHTFPVGFPPDWFYDPWCAERQPVERKHWSRISEFAAGDIKAVWEQGRFGFVLPLVRAFAWTGDARYVEAFWQATEDWRDKNPPQVGVHWKCGQEVALRLIAWVFGFFVFRGHAATTARRESMLAEMVEVSGRRIEAHIDYALSQKNNHGTSEATGLFTAGLVLSNQRWIARGCTLLDQLANELIYSDGAFSQHSTNYQRLMLHTYLWAIRLGEAYGCPLLSTAIEQVRRAGRWLLSLLSHENGRVPNLGANDGAHLFDLTDLGYLDYRPTVQAVGLVTEGGRWLPPGPWDELAAWLGVPVDPCRRPPDSGIQNHE
jgi:asparagine synthase (glutamine-hydrolysing)